MLGRQMRIALDHHRRAPAAQPLQLVSRCARLAVPGGPRMPQVVPAKISDPGTFQGVSPRQRIGMPKRFPRTREHPYGMLTELPSQHVQCRSVQWHRDWFAVLGLIRTDPRMPRDQVYPRPLQSEYIGLSQSRCRSSRRESRRRGLSPAASPGECAETRQRIADRACSCANPVGVCCDQSLPT